MDPAECQVKALYFMERTEASDVAAAAAAMVRLDTDVEVGYGDMQPASQQARVLKCTCAHAQCHKVLRVGTLIEAMRAMRDDPLACPADMTSTCCTRSEHVASFYAAAGQVDADSMYVWDWIDVPGGDGMHFDCTLIPLIGAFHAWRFEIDGRRHFVSQNCKREPADWKKDDIANNLGVPLLRLHWKDQPLWVPLIRRFRLFPEEKVIFSKSYRKYLQHQPELDDVWDWGV